jgi:hypothetical protein
MTSREERAVQSISDAREYKAGRLQLGSGTAEFTVAAHAGLPGYIERLKRIEDETRHERSRLAAAYWNLRAELADDEQFACAWRDRVERWTFLSVNELIDEHNEWYPIEARLRWDIPAGDYRAPFGFPWRKAPLDAAWALREFPAPTPAGDARSTTRPDRAT